MLTKILGSAKQCAGESEHVFPGPDGKQMTKDARAHRLDNIGVRAGIRLSSHRFRHSGITDALKTECRYSPCKNSRAIARCRCGFRLL